MVKRVRPSVFTQHDHGTSIPGEVDINGKIIPAGGLRFNTGKNRLTLLDADALDGLCAVLEFGAKKYARDNWRKGFPYLSLLDSMLRHAFAIMRGEDLDPESGLPHIDHIGCNWMFLSHLMKHRKDLDDRNPTVTALLTQQSVQSVRN